MQTVMGSIALATAHSAGTVGRTISIRVLIVGRSSPVASSGRVAQSSWLVNNVGVADRRKVELQRAGHGVVPSHIRGHARRTHKILKRSGLTFLASDAGVMPRTAAQSELNFSDFEFYNGEILKRK